MPRYTIEVPTPYVGQPAAERLALRLLCDGAPIMQLQRLVLPLSSAVLAEMSREEFEALADRIARLLSEA